MELLKSIVAKEEAMDLYQMILKSFFGESNEERLTKINTIQDKLNKNKDRTNKAMQMMLDEEIDSMEYRQIKSRYDEPNTTLLKQRASLEINKVDYVSKINGRFNLLKNVDKLYCEASIDIKHKLCV